MAPPLHRAAITKVMTSGESHKGVQNTGRWPWVHKKCIGINSSVIKVSKSFVCRSCTDQPASVDSTSMDNGVGASLELVDKFCYLGDTLSVA